jgi:yersiniabactin nonribosomal peptide synthetase
MEAAGEGPLTREAMRHDIAALLEEPSSSVGDDDDLLLLGLDSISVMRLATRWHLAGAKVTFADLIEWRTLREWWALVAGRPATGRDEKPAPTVDEAAPFELATMQRAYWIGRGDGQVLGGVGAHFCMEFDGRGVGPGRLEQAVRAVIARHGMLRARFLDDGRQQMMPDSPWRGLAVHDLRALPADAVAQRLAELRDRLSHRRLDVERGEVFDVALSLLPGGACRMHVQIEMMVADAQSFRVLLSDLARLYGRPGEPLPPISCSYPHYLAEIARRRPATRERAREYWQARLPDLPGAPQLPLAATPSGVGGHRTTRRYHWLGPDDWQQLAQRARAGGLTLSTVFLTAFAEVIGRWSSQDRFLLNLPLYDREPVHPDIGNVVGDFTNLVLIEADVSGERPFVERAGQLQARMHADVAQAAYSGVDVLRDLRRLHGEPVLAPVVFTSALSLGELFDEEVHRCFGAPGWTVSQTPQVWVDCQVTQRGGGLFVNWDAVEDLFPPGVLDAMFDAYLYLIEWLGESDWDCPTPDLLPAEQRTVRAQVNTTTGPIPDHGLHEKFFAQAAHTPDRIALAWDNGALRYGELAAHALQIAKGLTERGLRPGEPVAVTLPKGPDQVAAVLGVLAAGGAYVPIGTDQPWARRARISTNAGVRWVLTDAAQPCTHHWPENVTPLTVQAAAAASPLATPVPVDPDELAYIIYTSGSTGQPKGVEITHRAAVNTIDDLNHRFTVGPNDRVLAVSALDFDLSVYDLFGLLSTGGTVVLIDEADRRDAHRWAQLITRHHVTIWNSVPALLDMLLTTDEQGQRLATLRLVLASGDWIGLDLPGRLKAACPDAWFVALGGATEAAIWSNAHDVTDVPACWRSIPYGRPLRNQTYRVVDERGRDCPDWVAGELWIGGLGVARGYRNDPHRTAHHFLTFQGQRWYRTGDLGRYWPDGTLEFLGRADRQVKIRGHRIELGEVEAALQTHPHVTHAVAVTIGDPPTRRLAAAVVPTQPCLDLDDLRAFAAQQLPAAMLPDHLAVIDHLPLSPNGKIDHTALARHLTTSPNETDDTPPQTHLEIILAQIWSELLRIPHIGRNHNFFTLGGDSLTATQLITQLERRFGVEVSLRELFTALTVAELACVVAARQDEASAFEEGIV